MTLSATKSMPARRCALWASPADLIPEAAIACDKQHMRKTRVGQWLRKMGPVDVLLGEPKLYPTGGQNPQTVIRRATQMSESRMQGDEQIHKDRVLRELHEPDGSTEL